VTKSVTKSAKDITVDSAPAVKKSPLSTSVKPTSDDEEETTPAVEPVEATTVEAELEQEDAQQPPPKSESELRAEKVSNAAVEKYWKALEAQRIAKRVHQEGLSTGEKVLRYFDVSSQYGVSSRNLSNDPSHAVKLALSAPSLTLCFCSAVALHRYYSHEAMAPGGAAGSKSARRGPRRPIEGRGQGKLRHRAGPNGCYHQLDGCRR
jgi:hypothetical protein